MIRFEILYLSNRAGNAVEEAMRTVAVAANIANVIANVRGCELVSIVARILRHLTDRLRRSTHTQLWQHDMGKSCMGMKRMPFGKEMKLCPVPVSYRPYRSDR